MKEQTTRTPPKLRVLSAFLAVAMLLTLLPRWHWRAARRSEQLAG